MLKRLKYNIDHHPLSNIWGLNLVMLTMFLFVIFVPGEFIIPKKDLISCLSIVTMIMNFMGTTFIFLTSELKQVNITYVCPTARKYMSEQEIKEIERKD